MLNSKATTFGLRLASSMSHRSTHVNAQLHTHTHKPTQTHTHGEREREHTHEWGLEQMGPPQDLIHGRHGAELRPFVLDFDNAHEARQQYHRHRTSYCLHGGRTFTHFQLLQALHHKLSQRPNLHQHQEQQNPLHKQNEEQKLNHLSLPQKPAIPTSPNQFKSPGFHRIRIALLRQNDQTKITRVGSFSSDLERALPR